MGMGYRMIEELVVILLVQNVVLHLGMPYTPLQDKV